MTDDIVAELDEWLEITSGEPDAQWLAERPMIERARDEIVALRAFKARVFADVRAEVLEEAAQLAHANGFGETAAAIRALKEKH